jgi:sRNA-binding regulator protein Hfq
MFKRKSLEEFFEKVGKIAKVPITLYLIGGCNMSLRNMKPATKDVDVVLLNRKEMLAFKEALQQMGYAIDDQLFQEAVYQDAVIVFNNKSGSRIDVFVKVICNQLQLSE